MRFMSCTADLGHFCRHWRILHSSTLPRWCIAVCGCRSNDTVDILSGFGLVSAVRLGCKRMPCNVSNLSLVCSRQRHAFKDIAYVQLHACHWMKAAIVAWAVLSVCCEMTSNCAGRSILCKHWHCTSGYTCTKPGACMPWKSLVQCHKT